MKFQSLYSFLKTDIDLIERELEQAIYSRSPIIYNSSLKLLQAGGKRIRPIFVLLAAHFGNYDIGKIKNLAVALELIHMASLVHDDVIDDSDIRRGKPTVKAQWDNRVAMYTGDYLFARSLEYMTKLENVEVHKVLSDTIIEVCIGEMVQMKDKYRFDQNLRDYLRRIKRKTALLIAASCQLGAVASGAPPHICKKLYLFGYNVGMSYQIIDDILDFTGTEKQLGKPAGGDLLQGNVTLPVLYAMEKPGLREAIYTVNEKTSQKDIKRIIEQIKQSDAIQRSNNLSQRYLDRAIAILDDLPDNKAKKSLKEIAKYIGKRKY